MEENPFIQDYARELPNFDDVYMLKTTSRFRIFFRLDEASSAITIMDVATKERLGEFHRAMPAVSGASGEAV